MKSRFEKVIRRELIDIEEYIMYLAVEITNASKKRKYKKQTKLTKEINKYKKDRDEFRLELGIYMNRKTGVK